MNEWNQSDYKDSFSYEGKKALFEYLDELEEGTRAQIEMDIVALACDFTEYDSIEDCLKNYDNIKDKEELQDNTTLIEFEGGVIIQNF
jgi:hypothetical protein